MCWRYQASRSSTVFFIFSESGELRNASIREVHKTLVPQRGKFRHQVSSHDTRSVPQPTSRELAPQRQHRSGSQAAPQRAPGKLCNAQGGSSATSVREAPQHQHRCDSQGASSATSAREAPQWAPEKLRNANTGVVQQMSATGKGEASAAGKFPQNTQQFNARTRLAASTRRHSSRARMR